MFSQYQGENTAASLIKPNQHRKTFNPAIGNAFLIGTRRDTTTPFYINYPDPGYIVLTSKYIPNVLDLGRLPATYLKIPAKGLAANESVTNYNFASIDIAKYKFSSTALGSSSTEYGGWLANGTSGDSVAISAPFWVIIGDSQAEGHPGRHGRLHTSGGSVDLTLADLPGQLSYKLAELTNMRFFNQGIGGQTTSQVWTRWPRDVLAQTFDAGDGRPTKTLNRKPMGVVVIAGINDFYVAPVKTAAEVFGNLVNMAISARDNGIQCVILNCPGDEIITLNQTQRVDSLNALIAAGGLQELGASVIDYNSWWRDTTYDDNAHGQALITDDIHPSQAGYDSLGVYIFNHAKLPVIDSITFYTQISPDGFSGYSRPTGITIQSAAKTLSGEISTIDFGTIRLLSDSIYVKITASTNISGTSYSGFSHIVWHVRNDTTGLFTRRNQLYNNYPGLTTLWARSGNYISPSTITNKVTLGTTSNPLDAWLFVKSPLNTGNYIASFGSSTTNGVLSIIDNGRVVVNGSTSGPYNFEVAGSAMLRNTGNTAYNFFSGSAWECYGTPLIKLQTTAINTGSTGYSQCVLTYLGSSLTWQPSGTAGLDLIHGWTTKAVDWGFYINTSTKRMGSGTSSTFNYSVDFSYNTDGLGLPRGTTAQRGSVGGALSPIRFNTDLGKYEVNINPTWYQLITSQDYTAVTLTGENYLSLAGQVITANPVNLSGTNATGILAAARFPALTGDITTSSGSIATTIANDAVTAAKMANLAANRLWGRRNSTTGDPEPVKLGTNLSFSNDTLNVSGFGAGSVKHVKAGSQYESQYGIDVDMNTSKDTATVSLDYPTMSTRDSFQNIKADYVAISWNYDDLLHNSKITAFNFKKKHERVLSSGGATVNWDADDSFGIVYLNNASAITYVLPSAPTDREEVTIISTIAGGGGHTIDGNGKNINASATINVAGAYTVYQLFYSASLGKWLKIN